MALRPLASPLRDLMSPLITELPLHSAIWAPILHQRLLPPVIVATFTSLITLPPLLSDIWEGLLRAVPKKKTSYSKTRSRQLAGKALKDVTSLGKCSGCGRVKRMHILCPYCVQDIKDHWKQQAKKAKDAIIESDATSTR